MKTIVRRRLALLGVPAGICDSHRFESHLQEWARNVRVPTFLYQVRDDVLTHPSDVQAMFDNIPVADKQLQWIRTHAAGTATWNSSAVPSQCSGGSPSTCSKEHRPWRPRPE